MPDPTADFVAMLAAVEEARVVDFIRYANRQMLEQGSALGELPFRHGWLIVLGGYAELAARANSGVRDA